jgi:hypothetical protein
MENDSRKNLQSKIMCHCPFKTGHLGHLVVGDASGASLDAGGKVAEEDRNRPVPLLPAEGPPGRAEFHKNLQHICRT